MQTQGRPAARPPVRPVLSTPTWTYLTGTVDFFKEIGKPHPLDEAMPIRNYRQVTSRILLAAPKTLLLISGLLITAAVSTALGSMSFEAHRRYGHLTQTTPEVFPYPPAPFHSRTEPTIVKVSHFSPPLASSFAASQEVEDAVLDVTSLTAASLGNDTCHNFDYGTPTSLRPHRPPEQDHHRRPDSEHQQTPLVPRP